MPKRGREPSLVRIGRPDLHATTVYVYDEAYGKPFEYDPNFRGPREKRGCTDILCLFLFIVFLLSWAVLGYYAYRHGDPARVLMPTESTGARCGVDKVVADKPYLLVFDPSVCARPTVFVDGCSSPSACVKECPREDFNSDRYNSSDSLPLSRTAICQSGVEIPRTGTELQRLVAAKKCARWYKKSIAVGKICIPNLAGSMGSFLEVDNNTISNTTVEDVKKGVSVFKKAFEFGERVVSDITTSYMYVLGGLVIAMVLAIIYIVLMRWLAGPLVWTTIVGVLALLGVAIFICYTLYDDTKNGRQGVVIDNPSVPSEVQSLLDDPNFWLTLVIILGVILGILVLLTLFLRKRISLAITLIEEGGKAVSNNTSTLFFPVIPWLLQLAVIGYSAFVILYLCTSGPAIFKVHGLNATNGCSCGEYRFDGQECHNATEFAQVCSNCVKLGASCQFFRYDPPSYTKWLHLWNVFGSFWALFFISGMAQMILAGTFATWYWTFHKKDVPFFTLTHSFFVSLSYHAGTVAFGALLIAIVRTIRVILQYVEKKIKKYSDNAVARAILCCCQCCFTCVEKFLKFISRNAYIMCAIHGKNFCASAKDAFNLLMRNVIRVVVLDQVLDFVLFMGKLLITGLTCTALHFILAKSTLYLNYPAVPLVFAGIGAFFIASVFFSVYAMAVDTLFLCFLEDCERNDGSPEKPYFMSPNLMKVFGKHNHFKRD